MPTIRQYGNFYQLSEFNRGHIGVCAKMTFHRERLQISLTEINPPLCAATRHKLGIIRNAAEEEPVGE